MTILIIAPRGILYAILTLAPASLPPLGNTGGGGSSLTTSRPLHFAPLPAPAPSTGQSPGGAEDGATCSSCLGGWPAHNRGCRDGMLLGCMSSLMEACAVWLVAWDARNGGCPSAGTGPDRGGAQSARSDHGAGCPDLRRVTMC